MNILIERGWYNDPSNDSRLRFWNGTGWTGDVRPISEPVIRALPAAESGTLPPTDVSTRSLDAAMEKAAAKDLKTKRKQKERLERQKMAAAKEAKHLADYGRLMVNETFAAKGVWIYSKGFVAFGLFAPGVPQRLLAINSSSDVVKKTAIGRGVVGILTMGTNLVLTPNMRGDVYLTITSAVKTHMLHVSPPSESAMKAVKKIEAAGLAAIQIGVSAGYTSTSVIPHPDLSAQLEKLAALSTAGALTDDEFLAAKQKLLNL